MKLIDHCLQLMKNELGRKIMIDFVALTPKTYSYLMNNGNSDKKDKPTKKCAIKQKIKFNDYQNCLLNNKLLLKLYQTFKTEARNVYTEEINKIALSSNDDKRLQTLL